LAGVVAAKTILPVIGVPMPTTALSGIDSLLSIVQMPRGVPVATMAIGKAGAANGGLFAAAIIAIHEEALATRLETWRATRAKELLEQKIT
jgi:5-(carboxyamino)imidazole ribonucleotide mutase